MKTWKAKWILGVELSGLEPRNVFHKELQKSSLSSHREDLKNYHMLVRKTFSLRDKPTRAFLDITADDYYKLYINGRFVSQGPAPSYHFNYNYNHLNVSDFLCAGKNTIAVHVYYQGLINRVWNSGDYRQGLIAELFSDSDIILWTDSSWKQHKAQEFTSSETFGYETQFVEDIDSRLKISEWKRLDFDDTHWEDSVELLSNDYALVLQDTPQLAVYEMKPQTIERLSVGHYVIDFGREITGQFSMEACGVKGEIIEIMYGEELNADVDSSSSLVRHQMRCNCNYKDRWILSGELDVLEQFDYKAFRYVEIVGPEGALYPENFSAIVRHYPFNEEACTFQSSNILLNDIWEICKNGVKYGSQEVFVDCPSREKGQYLGDATITTLSHVYLTGDLRLFKKCLKDFAASAFICPGLMTCAPGSFMQEIADFSLQFPLQLLNYYKHSGDLEFLKEMLPVAEGVIDYFKKYKREDGLLQNVSEKWNLVDWPENLQDNYDFDLSVGNGKGCHNVLNAFYCGAVKTVDEIREYIGLECRNDYETLKEAFVQAFYKEESKLFVDSDVSTHSALHSNALPLFFGLVPQEAIKSVVELIKEKRFACGVYFSYFVLKGLSNAGEYELVFDLITSRDEHSWANMLSEGATTCFEAWGKEQKWNTSLCHPWASAPISVLIEDIAGIKPATPGFGEISFEPHLPSSIEQLVIEFQTVGGKVRLEHDANTGTHVTHNFKFSSN